MVPFPPTVSYICPIWYFTFPSGRLLGGLRLLECPAKLKGALEETGVVRKISLRRERQTQKSDALVRTTMTEKCRNKDSRTRPCVMVIFGASGELTKRKLIPPCNLAKAGCSPALRVVIGFSTIP